MATFTAEYICVKTRVLVLALREAHAGVGTGPDAADSANRVAIGVLTNEANSLATRAIALLADPLPVNVASLYGWTDAAALQSHLESHAAGERPIPIARAVTFAYRRRRSLTTAPAALATIDAQAKAAAVRAGAIWGTRSPDYVGTIPQTLGWLNRRRLVDWLRGELIAPDPDSGAGIIAAAYLHQPGTVSATTSMIPTIEAARGLGVAVEDFTVAGATYTGISVEPGIYYAALHGDPASDMTQASIRQHSDFPSKLTELAGLGSAVVEETSHRAHTIAAMIRPTTALNLWMTCDSDYDRPVFVVHRLV